jgi:hypothetical protein
MLQFSPPAQAGTTAAARIDSASRRWIHCVTIDFIASNYKITAEWMSTGKAGEARTETGNRGSHDAGSA